MEREKSMNAEPTTRKGNTMRKDDERAELVASRDEAERIYALANRLAHESITARNVSCKTYNDACMAVYDYDVAQSSD